MTARSASDTALVGGAPAAKRGRETAFRAVLLLCLGVALVALAALLVTVVAAGRARLNDDLWRRFPSPRPELAGARSALFGSLWVISVTALLTVPIGVAAALYLEELAPQDRWYYRLVEVNIQNLAAVPSIVYGILGLAFVVRGPLSLGRVVLAAAVILSLLVLPTVIIASREALRAVPQSIRDGALALGATQLQTVSRQVLPAAIPGIATGIILALSRAIGEAAPLLMVGALTFVTFNPSGLDSAFTVLPVQIFNWVSRPQAEFHVLAAATIVMLLVMLLVMNGAAIWVRNRFRRRW